MKNFCLGSIHNIKPFFSFVGSTDMTAVEQRWAEVGKVLRHVDIVIFIQILVDINRFFIITREKRVDSLILLVSPIIV